MCAACGDGIGIVTIAHMNFGRLGVLLVSSCFFIAGCGANNVDERAQAIIDQIPTVEVDTRTDQAEVCVEVTEQDEYGIDVTFLLCGDDVPADQDVADPRAAPTASMSPLEWTEADHADAFQHFIRTELILGGGCDVSLQDSRVAATALSPLAEGPEKAALSAVVAAADRVGPSCATEQAWLTQYKAATIALAEGGAQLANATGLPASTADDVGELLDTADAATTLRITADLYTNFAWILDGGPPDSAAHDDLWWDYVHLSVARSMPAEVDIALIGDSQAQFGLDPQLISQTTERVTGNFALPGLNPQSAGTWAERFVVPVHTPELVVIAVSEIGFVAANEGVCGADQIAALLDAQDGALARVPFDTDLSAWEIFAGRGSEALAIQSPYNRAIQSRIDASGVFVGFPELTEQGQENRLEARTRTAAQPYCPSRTEELVALVHRLEAQGITTVVALMPIADYLAVLWDDRPVAVMPLVEEALTAAAIDVVDLRVLSPDEMLDPVHANAAGQVVLSTELAQAINRLAPS